MNDLTPARLRRRLARSLTIAGSALIALTVGVRTLAVVGAEAGIEAFRLAAAERAGDRDPVEGWQAEAIDPDRSLWAEGRIAAWRESLAQDLGVPVAVLRIPRLRLEVPVWQGVDETTLNRGLGWIAGTAPVNGPGNVGVAGHRDGFFRVLEGIAVGDAVELETLSGVERFAVTDVWIVDPQSVWVLDPTPETSLTLVTCYPFYFVGKAPNRFVVRARETGGGPVSNLSERGDDAAEVARQRDALW